MYTYIKSSHHTDYKNPVKKPKYMQLLFDNLPSLKLVGGGGEGRDSMFLHSLKEKVRRPKGLRTHQVA